MELIGSGISVRTLFANVIQIADIHHSKEKLWALDKSLCGSGNGLVERCSEDCIVQLKVGDLEEF